MIFMTHLDRFEDLFHGLFTFFTSSMNMYIHSIIWWSIHNDCFSILSIENVYTQGCQAHCKEILPRRTKEPYPYSIMSLIGKSKLLTRVDPWWAWCSLRLFYSNAYLTRLEELTRENSLGFTFPQTGGHGALRTCSISLAFKHISTYFNSNVGIAMSLAPPIKLMVGIPPIFLVMNGGWFMTLLYQQ